MSFEQECLDAHNKYRRNHGVPAMKLNSSMSTECRKFAEVLVNESSLRNGQVEGVGENLFSLTSSNKALAISGHQPAEHWYAKSSEHDYNHEPSPGSTLSTGNFSQMVWKDSKELGVGFARREGKIVVVARYVPQGNIMGRFKQNVLPPKNSSSMLAKFTSALTSSWSGSLAHNFNSECLHAHNHFRAKHAVPALRLDADLCNYSQEWAEILAQMGAMQHRPQTEYGENLFSMRSSNPNFAIAGGRPVEVWYEEIQLYTFGREPSSLQAGHFSQVVWKDTRKLGVGVAKKDGSIYVVCNYSPPGNFVGSHIANVLAPRK